ncbi:hypothetical protein GF371_00110 [Candidatus Woesearchaeota archaeon]|nr:hypothetical protein [Candidatus Woesearchaeota archaeon]
MGIGMNYKILLTSALFIIILAVLVTATSNKVGDIEIVNIQAQNFTGTLGTDFSGSFQVQNNGTQDLAVTFDRTGLSGLEVVFSPGSRTVGAGNTDTINFEIRTDPGDGAGNYSGTLRATVNSSHYDYFDANVELFRSSTTDMLIIENVNIEGVRVTENQIAESFRPDYPMDIELDVRSLFTETDDPTIKNIEVTVKIEDIEDRGTDDIDMDAVEFNLDSRESKNLDEFEFRIPYDVEDNRVYDVIITAKGRDQESVRHEAEFRAGLRTIKDKNDVRFTRLDIIPLTVECGETLTADIQVTNLGTSDESEAAYTLKNDMLNIFARETFELKSDSNSDKFEFNKLHYFDIPEDALPGTYTILAKAFYESKKETDSEDIRIKVKCSKPEEPEEEEEEPIVIPDEPEEEEETAEEPPETPEEEEKETETTSQPGRIESADTGSLLENKAFLAAAIIFILAIALLIIYILYLLMF